MNLYNYIYCITYTGNEVPTNTLGMDDELVTSVHYKDICAIVSPTTKKRYEITLDNLQCHEKIVSAFRTILPLSFSTIVATQEDVKKLLETYYDQFKENLSKVEDKVELGIKIFYKLEDEFDLNNKMHTKEDPRTYIMSKYELYQKRKKQINEISKVVDQIHNELTKISYDSTFYKPFKNNLILNSSFLVEINDVHQFKHKVEELIKQYSDFKIVYSGPFAPYHFTKLNREE